MIGYTLPPNTLSDFCCVEHWRLQFLYRYKKRENDKAEELKNMTVCDSGFD